MSLGPSGSALIREGRPQTEYTKRSATNKIPTESGRLQSYFEAAIKKYEQDQRNVARQMTGRYRIPATAQERLVPDV